MKPQILPPIISIHDMVINSNSISYFQHGQDQNKTRHYIKFKMICGDMINFDFHVPEEYEKIINQLLENEPKMGGKIAENTEKTTKKRQKKLKILPKNDPF